MQLNIHDSTLKRVGFINNNLPDALHYFDDNWHRYLAEGTSTFDFSVNKINSSYALLTLQSYISFTYDGEDYLFNIINIEQDHYSMHLQCENLNLELISEEVGAYGNTKRHSIVWYLKNVAKITDDFVEIGNNPFPLNDEDSSNPILSFDSTDTKLARIISICNSFNAEFQFRTQLKNDGTLQNITIDLYKEEGVGQKRKDVTLYYGKNIAGITSKADRTSTFFNATTVTDSKNKFNWLSVEGKNYNSDGQLEFYKNAGDNTAYAPLSRDMFPSQLKSSSSDRYTRKNLSIEATSANSLWDYAVSQFKLYAYPQMTYEVSVAVNAVTSALGNDRRLDIGDTIIVQDKTFDKSEGGLILSARVSEQEISFTNPHDNKITFTNFVKLKSEISADLYGRMKDLVDQNTPYKAEVETTNGLQFKNGKGSTTLTARIYFGSDSSETKANSYEWRKDGTLVANVQEITVDASGIDGKAVYAYKATFNEKVVGTASVTITNVNDGEDGTDGTDGRSVTGIEQKYQLTQTDATPANPWEDEVWQTSQPKMTATNKYLWSITRTTFNQAPLTQDIVEQKAVYGDSGEDGSDGDPGKIVSDEEPTTKFKGLTWKYIGITAVDASDGTNIQPNTEYYWNGKNWVINLIKAQNIDVEKLTAFTANLGDATAGSLTVEKGATGGIAVKDGLVKSWDVSKMTDPNYPDGYSYTSMGVALDSGGLTIYSAGYGHTLDKGGVIDPKYKVASLQAIASNGRNSIGTGLVLNATNSNFPFTINGNIDVIGGIRQTSKTTSVTIGAGLTLSLERRGETVIAILIGTINSSLTSGQQFGVGKIPLGYRPNTTANIPAHMTSSYNGAHIDAGIDGVCTWWGPSTNTGYPRGSQMWFTNDSLPN
nr:MAG TPA: tail protein [Caudoviricetes sp.]